MPFLNRQAAGRLLAESLRARALEAPVVLGLPRGGVPVAFEVARALGAPLDVLVVRKLGAPLQPELGVGAIAEGGVVFVDEPLRRELGIGDEWLARMIDRERAELERRVRRYRGGRALTPLHGRTALLVDDGVATGGTAIVAARAARALGARRVVVAVPVCPPEAAELLRREADEVIALALPPHLVAVGAWYEDFGQVDDAEVAALLAPDAAAPRQPLPVADPEIRVPVAGGSLEGTLALPPHPAGVVVFAHGSGSSRFSPRNRSVATALQQAGLATVLIDLLTEEEGELDVRTGAVRFDIPLLADRVVAILGWVRSAAETAELPIGCFGASTGAAAALLAAARLPDGIAAVVSRGGRPDLAGAALPSVRAPTLLVVGGEDEVVLELNRQAMRAMRCDRELVIVPGATHLFEEEGALERVAEVAASWFVRHLHRPGEAARV